MKTVIEMALEVWSAGIVYVGPSEKSLTQFAELVRADERNSWPAEMEAMERQVNILTDALADEREACAKGNAETTLREALNASLAEQPARTLEELYELSREVSAEQQALDKMAENARELGLDYEPVWGGGPTNKDYEDAMRQRRLHQLTAPQPAQQEPVALGVDWGKAGDIPCVSIIKRLPDGRIEVMAVEYGPQRTWVGLTDEEIDSLDCLYLNWLDYEQVEINGDKEFARAIEAKLKEKNT